MSVRKNPLDYTLGAILSVDTPLCIIYVTTVVHTGLDMEVNMMSKGAWSLRYNISCRYYHT